MKKLASILMILLLAIQVSGCVTMAQSEQNALYELSAYKISWEQHQLVKPRSAAWLSLLPGGGYYYMAHNADEYYPELWGMAVFNTVTWPLSWFWGIPMSYADACNINKKELVRFYQYNPVGQQQLHNLDKEYRSVDLGLRPRGGESI